MTKKYNIKDVKIVKGEDSIVFKWVDEKLGFGEITISEGAIDTETMSLDFVYEVFLMKLEEIDKHVDAAINWTFEHRDADPATANLMLAAAIACIKMCTLSEEEKK